MKTAIVIGSTGLVGKELVKLLLEDKEYSKVKTFSRRSLNIKVDKLEEFLISFDELEKYNELITGDELFSCLGTTIKKAGTKKEQYKIDFEYQLNFAKIASENSVKNYFLVSSTGANPKSKNFYLRIKGELEDSVKLLPFEKTVIFQPSILVGKRDESRILEKVGIFIMNFLTLMIPAIKKYKPIPARTVAIGMLNSAKDIKLGKHTTYSLDQIFSRA
ncbi:MAG: NAD-dependent epimerase/dehydratase family protein [Melioribacteraceae bacterium]|nr:NAD-dependent epimerase/dehydratase family protein [Melioribacteraceae bacterium]